MGSTLRPLSPALLAELGWARQASLLAPHLKGRVADAAAASDRRTSQRDGGCAPHLCRQAGCVVWIPSLAESVCEAQPWNAHMDLEGARLRRSDMSRQWFVAYIAWVITRCRRITGERELRACAHSCAQERYARTSDARTHVPWVVYVALPWVLFWSRPPPGTAALVGALTLPEGRGKVHSGPICRQRPFLFLCCIWGFGDVDFRKSQCSWTEESRKWQSDVRLVALCL